MTSTALRGPTGQDWDDALSIGGAWARTLTTRAGVTAGMLADQRRVAGWQERIDAADPTTMAGRSDIGLYTTHQQVWIRYRDAAAKMLADDAGWDGDTWIGSAT
jgi:hypothetical protein